LVVYQALWAVSGMPFPFVIQSVAPPDDTGACQPVIIRKELFPKVMICNSDVLQPSSLPEFAFVARSSNFPPDGLVGIYLVEFDWNIV
jgi:hypothetical protein